MYNYICRDRLVGIHVMTPIDACICSHVCNHTCINVRQHVVGHIQYNQYRWQCQSCYERVCASTYLYLSAGMFMIHTCIYNNVDAHVVLIGPHICKQLCRCGCGCCCGGGGRCTYRCRSMFWQIYSAVVVDRKVHVSADITTHVSHVKIGWVACPSFCFGNVYLVAEHGQTYGWIEQHDLSVHTFG